MADRPKIGLALGSGGARGFAHIGVLKVLEEEGIPIDMIAGSSIGALVAALYGAGRTVRQMQQLSGAFKRKYYLDFKIGRMGLISGKRIEALIKLLTHRKRLEDLRPPVAVVATNLANGKKVVFTKGPVAEAVRASISIPGIFVPKKIGGFYLVDGGVADRVPVSVAKGMGAEIVVGVDVAVIKREAEIHHIYDVIMQSIDIMQMEIAENRKMEADVMIRPDSSMYSSRAFTNAEQIIKIGEEAAKKAVPKIKQSMNSWKEQNE
ncbi:esterase [Weizmannia acidilactici]|uniref:Esterase n=1 Tax=Weizmannia acidilactici TaxID=2607726 RepID=A0A5J4JK06_9BACI|nr:patatin-like phospholipase family protein [Weizmannia acidilactici]GER68178.1 esterase [Weizmannia acidilactici]GER71025.1 esterase [Weizmannia acidilactici]GER74466.1 esterase [Weizmannia acidilactici]